MKTWDLVNKLTQTEGVTLYNVNANLMQISRSNGKRRPGFVKFAISDETADKLLRPIQPNGAQAFMIVADIETVNRILDDESKGSGE